MSKICDKCGGELTLLFTSFYCDFCEKPENKNKTVVYGFIMVSEYWISLYGHKKVVPSGTLIYVYRTKDEVAQILGPNHKIGMVTLTYEPSVKYSQIWLAMKHTEHRLPLKFAFGRTKECFYAINVGNTFRRNMRYNLL